MKQSIDPNDLTAAPVFSTRAQVLGKEIALQNFLLHALARASAEVLQSTIMDIRSIQELHIFRLRCGEAANLRPSFTNGVSLTDYRSEIDEMSPGNRRDLFIAACVRELLGSTLESYGALLDEADVPDIVDLIRNQDEKRALMKRVTRLGQGSISIGTSFSPSRRNVAA